MKCGRISATITAGDNIGGLYAGDSISGKIKAGGTIGRIDTQDWVAYGATVGGLGQDISGSIEAGGGIDRIFAGRDLLATVNAARTGKGDKPHY